MTLEELVLHYDSLKGLAIQEPDVVDRDKIID